MAQPRPISVARMTGWLCPNRLTHQELIASRWRRPSRSRNHTPCARATGISGNAAPSGACRFIWVQGCHTAARLRWRQASLVDTGSIKARLPGAG